MNLSLHLPNLMVVLKVASDVTSEGKLKHDCSLWKAAFVFRVC